VQQTVEQILLRGTLAILLCRIGLIHLLARWRGQGQRALCGIRYRPLQLQLQLAFLHLVAQLLLLRSLLKLHGRRRRDQNHRRRALRAGRRRLQAVRCEWQQQREHAWQPPARAAKVPNVT
jgi:hypothetical protein